MPVGPAPAPLTGPPVVAFAGRLVPEKGVDVLVRALARARRRVPGTRAVVAGHGPERAALERLAAEEGVADAVESARLGKPHPIGSYVPVPPGGSPNRLAG